jgi:hypothetical protein
MSNFLKTQSDLVERIYAPAKVISSLKLNQDNKKNVLNSLIEKGRIKKENNFDYEKYINSDDHIFYSYGDNVNKGVFYFNNGTILEKICDSKQYEYFMTNYCFVEKKTDYYQCIFDLDFKETDKNYNKYIDKIQEITNLIIDKINITLKIIFKNPNIKFIYCDKNKGTGIHLYYPNIIVNKIVHIEIYNLLLNCLLKDKTFDFDKNIWNTIVDVCTSKANGLRLPYFAINGKYYKQNKKMSTFNIDEFDGYPNKNILKLCLVRTNKIKCCPELKINIYEENNNNELDKVCKKSKNTKLTLQITKITNIEKEIYEMNNGEKYELNFKTKSHINKISINQLDNLLKCINIDKFLKFSNWFQLKFIIFNCNNSIESCKLFYKYGKIESYKSVTYDQIEKHFMNTKEDKNFNIDILKCYARRDNSTLFNFYQLGIDYENQFFDTIKFNRPKITRLKNENIDSFIEKETDLFINDKKGFFPLDTQIQLTHPEFNEGWTNVVDIVAQDLNGDGRKDLVNAFRKAKGYN